jgi:class 3 adenylate cyclase
MPMSDRAATVALDQPLLAARLAALAAAIPGNGDLLRVLGAFVRTAPDEAIVGINPIRFAAEHGFASGAVVDAFLHARRAGLLSMEWQYVCPGCGEIIERLSSLAAGTAHAWCQVCTVARDADLSDFIEITFGVTPEIRRSRYLDPWALSPEEHFLSYRMTQSGVVGDGVALRDHLKHSIAACAYVEPGATRAFDVAAKPGYLWLTDGSALIVRPSPTGETRSFAIVHTGARAKGLRAQIDAGPVRIDFTNATATRYALMIVRLAGEYELRLSSFLSGADLLSSQTFRELFPAETIAVGEGLAVKRLALLFTDLQGSTALYERIGDIKAFELVRRHFDHLRECIAGNSGALVKTIGDAVMASFVDPAAALCAALAMRERIARFNAEAGGDLLNIKIGLHSGACLAVTLNDRLDYFGQTVNIAARVQAQARAGEIVLTDDVLSQPGAPELLADLDVRSGDARLKGIAQDLRVHRVCASRLTG